MKHLSHLTEITWSRSIVTMATNLPSCFSIQLLEQLLRSLVNFTLLKYVKSQKLWLFNHKELIFGFQYLNLKDHFSASLRLDTCHSLQKIDFCV